MTLYEGRSRRNRIVITLAVAAAVVVFVLSRGCSFAGGPVSGRVLDLHTGQPLAGAIVVVRWNGAAMGLVHSSRVCFHVETAISDVDGRYRVSSWLQPPKPWAVWGASTTADAYRLGYESVRTQKTLTEAPDDVFMERSTGPSAEHFQYLNWQVSSSTGCDNAGASRRNLFALQKAAILEAKSLVRSEKDQENLEGMRRVAATDWLAATPSYSQTYDRPLENLPVNVRRELE